MPIQKITETETSSSASPDTHFLVTQPEADEAGKIIESLRRIRADDIANMLKEKFGLGDTAKEIASLKEEKINKPKESDNNKIARAKNGEVEWVDVGQPTDEQTSGAVTKWLDKHPEATTTVQNGVIGEKKIETSFLPYIKNDYVTPQMFGAKGDGIIDDTTAVQNAIQYAINNSMPLYVPKHTYLITSVKATSNLTIISKGGTFKSSRRFPLIFTTYAENVVIDGLSFVGDTTLDQSSGRQSLLSFRDGGNNIKLLNCVLKDSSGQGLNMSVYGDEQYYSDIEISNCSFTNLWLYGLIITPYDGVKVHDCYFSYIYGNLSASPVSNGHAIYLKGTNDSLSNVHSLAQNAEVYNNVIENIIYKSGVVTSNHYAIKLSANDEHDTSYTQKNIHVYGNTIRNCVGGIWIISAEDVYLHDNYINISGTGESTNGGVNALALWYQMTRVRVVNNTIIKNNPSQSIPDNAVIVLYDKRFAVSDITIERNIIKAVCTVVVTITKSKSATGLKIINNDIDSAFDAYYAPLFYLSNGDTEIIGNIMRSHYTAVNIFSNCTQTLIKFMENVVEYTRGGNTESYPIEFALATATQVAFNTYVNYNNMVYAGETDVNFIS